EVGVFALGVLAHHEVVDVTRLATDQGTWHAVEQAYRPQVDVLIELAAELQQRAPQRNVVGHRGRPADGPEVDRVEAFELLLPVVRHHLAVLYVPVAAGPFDPADLELEVKPLGGRPDDAQALGQDFLADAVAGDGCNAEHGVHRFTPSGDQRRPRPVQFVEPAATQLGHGARQFLVIRV